MSTITPAQRAAMLAVCNAVTEAVTEAGQLGAPAGHLYAALMAHGCRLAQFESLMAALQRAGRVTKRGYLYFAPNNAPADTDET